MARIQLAVHSLSADLVDLKTNSVRYYLWVSPIEPQPSEECNKDGKKFKKKAIL